MKYANVWTHTHTHTGFHVLWGHSIVIMVFILYKLYFPFPYPKLSPHTKLCAFLDFTLNSKQTNKTLNSVLFISLFPRGDQNNILIFFIYIIYYTYGGFGPHNIGNSKHTHTHIFSHIFFFINIVNVRFYWKRLDCIRSVGYLYC